MPQSLSMLKVSLIGVTSMNQHVQLFTVTFGVSLGVMSVLGLISFGLEAHEQSKREAELRQLCNDLNQYTSSVQQQGNQASRLELMGGMYTKNLHDANCR